MNLLNKITNFPNQQFFLTGIPGDKITLTMRFLPTQNLWVMDIIYNDFSVYGLSIINAVNILRGFRNIIPFGIACITNTGLDPSYLDDFSTQRAALWLLDADDVAALESQYFT